MRHTCVPRMKGFCLLDYTNRADLRHFTDTPEWEYIFLHGISDVGVIVARSKAVDDVPRTYVGGTEGLHELRFPGSVSTEGWNINQDSSVVGHYDSPDGRRHGFIARPTSKAASDYFGNVYHVGLAKGSEYDLCAIGTTNADECQVTCSVDRSDDRYHTRYGKPAIRRMDTECTGRRVSQLKVGKGYIVNVPETRQFAFVGSRVDKSDGGRSSGTRYIRGNVSRTGSVGVCCEWSFGGSTRV